MQPAVCAERQRPHTGPALLERLQIFEQFLFVLAGQLSAVGVTLIAVSFLSAYRKENTAPLISPFGPVGRGAGSLNPTFTGSKTS